MEGEEEGEREIGKEGGGPKRELYYKLVNLLSQGRAYQLVD